MHADRLLLAADWPWRPSVRGGGSQPIARRADYEAELNQRQSPLIVSMAAHAFLLCSLALLSALSRPGLSFTDEELQPGLVYEEVPEILDRSKENSKQATRVTSSQDGGYGLESEEVILTPEDENPLRRILQPFNWHQPGMSHSKRKLLQLSLRFGDVEDLRGLMSNTFYEAAGQNWFTLDSVHIHYNWTQEATFNASEVYAPATSSYHCQHVSSLHKYDTLLVPSSHTDTSANWHITFTDFQIQAFNVQSDKFASGK
ncbi:hypothetical protein INR49_008825 [Caranx melampygus]|nr:hypothetical protein INR49_008825 [Caranx melampygus]